MKQRIAIWMWMWVCYTISHRKTNTMYMGSSSVVVLIGSHSLCNSFVVNQFLYFTPNGENSLCYTPKKQWEQFGGEKNLYYFLLAKYTPMSRKNGGQKWEWRYPTACVGSYFIPDENIQTYLICLQSCNMQKHQKINFRTAEYVCVQQWWLKVSITHISWPVTSWNMRSLPTCTRSTMRTGENTVAINNKALSMPRSEHQICRIIS